MRLSFRWFLALSWMLQKCGIVSRIIPYYFNRQGTGSHLYPANTNTLRSGHRVEVLPTLVGHSLWDCLTLAFCTLIASYFKGFVKNFFEEFLFHLIVDWVSVAPRP